MKQPIVVLGDTHFPFASRQAIIEAVKLIGELQPRMVIQIGDLYDLYAFTKFPKHPDFMPAREEMRLGRERAERMWRQIQSVSPKSKMVQMRGNHDARAAKRAMEDLPASFHLIEAAIQNAMTFYGVELTDKQEYMYDGICFMHGFRKHGEHAEYNQMNTVVGHSHRAGVSYHANRSGPFWELNAGWLGDIEAECFTYRAQKALHKTTLGVGVIDDCGPRFVAL